MSVKVTSLCWRLPLPVAEKLVLIRLADFADHDGSNVYPAVATVAGDCGVSERAVQYIMKKFREDGLLVLVGNPTGGRGKARQYAIDLERIKQLSEQEPKRAQTVQRAQNLCTLSTDDEVSKRVQDIAEKGEVILHPTRQLPVNKKESPFNSPASISDQADDPSLFGEAEAKPSANKAKGKRRKIEYSDDFVRFWDINPNRGPDGHDKGRAYKNWKAAIAGGATAEAMIDGWTNYVNGKRETQDYGTHWIKSAQNFLDPENRMWLRFQSAPADNVAEFPDEPRWKTDPHAWSDINNPPPWPDAPVGTKCGRWMKASTRWMFMGSRGARA